MAKLVFMIPHTGLSGGTKVILRLANMFGLKESYDVHVIANRVRDMSWFFPVGAKPAFRIWNKKMDNWQAVLRGAQWVVNFGDGDPYIPLDGTTKHVLYLQGFGTQDRNVELHNLHYGYDHVICTSQWLAQIAQRCGHDTCVVPPGIDEHFQPTKIARVQTTIGALYHEADTKNIGAFLSSMSSLAIKNPEWKLKTLLLSAKLPTNMSLFESMHCPYEVHVNPTKSMLPYLYGCCNVWASPSTNEGFGLTTLEAMACGIPVVWAPSSGLQEYLQDNVNCVVAPETKDGIFSKVKMLIENRQLAQEIAANGQRLASTFTWEKCFEDFNHALLEI